MCIYAVIRSLRIKLAKHQSGSVQKKKVAQWMQDFMTSALGNIDGFQSRENHPRHVGGQNNSKLWLVFYIKIESNSQKTFSLLVCTPTWPRWRQVKTIYCVFAGTFITTKRMSTNDMQGHSWPKISLKHAELCQSYHFSGNLIQFYELFSTAYHVLKTDSKKRLKVDEGQLRWIWKIDFVLKSQLDVCG